MKQLKIALTMIILLAVGGCAVDEGYYLKAYYDEAGKSVKYQLCQEYKCYPDQGSRTFGSLKCAQENVRLLNADLTKDHDMFSGGWYSFAYPMHHTWLDTTEINIQEWFNENN